jgi:hypothetical protein
VVGQGLLHVFFTVLSPFETLLAVLNFNQVWL